MLYWNWKKEVNDKFLLSDLVCAIEQATNANSANRIMIFMSVLVNQPEN